MGEKEVYEITVTVHSYKNVVDAFKEKNKLTNSEVIQHLQQALQVQAWADVYPEMQRYLDWENSPEGKRHIEERANSDGGRTK